jgi:hypothetical protein
LTKIRDSLREKINPALFNNRTTAHTTPPPTGQVYPPLSIHQDRADDRKTEAQFSSRSGLPAPQAALGQADQTSWPVATMMSMEVFASIMCIGQTELPQRRIALEMKKSSQK